LCEISANTFRTSLIHFHSYSD
ncbi:putative TPP requiring enzyme, partial [Trichinella spiralis]